MYVTNFKTFYILLNTLNDNQMVFSFNFKTDSFFLNKVQDLFHVYLNKFELHILLFRASLVLPSRQDDNLKHRHNTAALNTSPPHFY